MDSTDTSLYQSVYADLFVPSFERRFGEQTEVMLLAPGLTVGGDVHFETAHLIRCSGSFMQDSGAHSLRHQRYATLASLRIL